MTYQRNRFGAQQDTIEVPEKDLVDKVRAQMGGEGRVGYLGSCQSSLGAEGPCSVSEWVGLDESHLLGVCNVLSTVPYVYNLDSSQKR